MSRKLFVLPLMLLMLVFSIACSQQRANAPDSKDAVESALKQASLNNVSVDQDREKGVITLKGDVRSEDEKARAAQIAQSTAGGMIVANEIGVRPKGMAGDQAKEVGSNTDDAIESHMKAAIAAHNWDNQHVTVDANNGVLTLKGDVYSTAQREQVQKIAKDVPGVQQVVNELEVKAATKRRAATR